MTRDKSTDAIWAAADKVFEAADKVFEAAATNGTWTSDRIKTGTVRTVSFNGNRFKTIASLLQVAWKMLIHGKAKMRLRL